MCSDRTAGIVDDAHRVLRSRCRRLAIRSLIERDGRVAKPTLVDEVWAAADDGADRERVAIEFHHRHLPVFRDADLVDVDDGGVRLTARGRTVARADRAVTDATEDAGARI
ncbi:MAG: hypothetical protein ABEJ70_05640 [Halobacteriaceae archaeon]